MQFPNNEGELPQLLDITTLAQYLGVNTRHVRRLVAERRIPFIKWGHLIHFDPVEVREWIDAYRRHPCRTASTRSALRSAAVIPLAASQPLSRWTWRSSLTVVSAV
ncbi:MAG TPA: helix-turn-helix domain-containing protein [Acidimicrobiales bacterium]|nr:helix-turn-helix domain-containing protein [Acidimicrobiales bacterium]